MLDTAFTIHTQSEELARRLDFIIHEAEQCHSPLKDASYEFNIRDGVYEIRRGGNLCFSSDDLPDTIFNLQWLIHKKALKDVTESIRIHAGCGELRGRRFLVSGDKGAGKTTLMVRLLFAGFRIIGDELVLVRNGKATPFPRRFHIKQDSSRLLPELEGLFDSLPYNRAVYGHKMFSFSPQDAGFEWKIDEGDIHSIFYLEPNHGGQSRIEACPKFMMVNRIMPMSFLSETADHMKINQLCSIIDRADCYVLHLGDLEGAVSAMQEKMSVL